MTEGAVREIERECLRRRQMRRLRQLTGIAEDLKRIVQREQLTAVVADAAFGPLLGWLQ